MSTREPYRALCDMITSGSVATYFEKRIKDEIHPVIRSLIVRQWYIRDGESQGGAAVLWDGHHGLGPALQAVWPSEDVPLVLGSTWRPSDAVRASARYARRALWRLLRRFYSLNSRGPAGKLPGPKSYRSVDPSLANPAIVTQHYAEGVDLTRRSDLFWFPQSQIDPRRILVHFQHGPPHVPKSRSSPELRKIETWGMSWLELDQSMADPDLPPSLKRVWSTSPLVAEYRRAIRSTSHRDSTDRWVMWESEFLLREVDYWCSFYEKYNIKVHFEPQEGYHEDVAQRVALDLVGGIRLGKQRSEVMGSKVRMGFHPHHVFFTWGRHGIKDLISEGNRIDHIVVSGFPNDAAIIQNRELSITIRSDLVARGARLIVALFDETYGRDMHFSKSMMETFYARFLQWVIDDPEVGVVIKSKKPEVIGGLPEIHSLLAEAEATGRCLRLGNVFGRLPSDASQAADISVGMGIASTVTEAAIAGGKAVNCDLGGLWSHPFYQHGYERVVFDDLNRLMAALERYKENPDSEPGLGDFSPVIDGLDPFRDGRAGERIGCYIRWLLEAFDTGQDRDSAIRQANERYAGEWGADKVISVKECSDGEPALQF